MAERVFEALPVGLALCSGREILHANSSFAMAFGYACLSDLLAAGGLQAVFPDDTDSFDQPLIADGRQQERPLLAAVTRSRRRITMPLAIHDILVRDGQPVRLLILHPEPAAAPAKEREDGPRADGPTRAERTDEQPDGETEPPDMPQDGGDKGKSTGSEVPAEAQPSEKTRVPATPEAEVLAKISHGVRTPLNTIIGFAELMQEEQLGPVGNDRYKRYIGDILDSGRHALSIVNDLLDISQLEAGQLKLNFTSVDLNEVIAGCIRTKQAESHENRVFLRISLAPGLPAVLADRNALEQAILNLLTNAITFTNPGGQVVIATQAEASGGVRIRVRDNGIGLSQDDIAQTMHPYTQPDTAPRKQVGTGLTLPLARALAKANRAEFVLKSAPSSGTCVDIIFPADRTAAR
jgi:hypothetical protein